MKKLRYALIGCGRISSKHVESIIANHNKYLPIACVDIIKDKAQNSASMIEKFFNREIKVYTSYEDLLDKEELDVIAIATPSGSHAEIALKALENDVNVICEKPMALSTYDCDKLIEKEKKSTAKMIIVMQNRYNKPIRKLKEAIEKNELGKIYHGQISVRWNRNKEYYSQAEWRCTWKEDGGALMNQCSHGIDLLQWMIGGKPRSVYGIIKSFKKYREAEDFGAAIVEFDNDTIGLIEGTVNSYPRNLEEKFSIFAEKGTGVIGGLAVNYIETWRVKDQEFEDPICKNPPNVYGNGHLILYKDFYKTIINNEQPYITPSDGKNSIEIILGIYKSYKTG
ncbi:MAG: Gfo/Idh/MocA family protein, partial [Promethearchaeota archaeon]